LFEFTGRAVRSGSHTNACSHTSWSREIIKGVPTLAFLGLEHTHDLTAVGTTALAVVTAVSLVVGYLSLRQTRNEIALSRSEVEEAHRPVLVPFVDPATVPSLNANGLLRIPVQNIGAGPALEISGNFIVPLTSAPKGTIGTGTAVGVGVAADAWLDRAIPDWQHVFPSGDLVEFALTLSFHDLAGKKWETRGVWDPALRQYRGLTIGHPAPVFPPHEPGIVKRSLAAFGKPLRPRR
jgi:hypothetical protein